MGISILGPSGEVASQLVPRHAQTCKNGLETTLSKHMHSEKVRQGDKERVEVGLAGASYASLFYQIRCSDDSRNLRIAAREPDTAEAQRL